MPNIRKGDTTADAYIFPQAASLQVREPEPRASEAPKPLVDPRTPIDYAKLQAEAILADAEAEAQEIRERAQAAIAEELEALRHAAREEGYTQGFAEGMAGAMLEAKVQREEQAVEQAKTVQRFLEGATEARERLLCPHCILRREQRNCGRAEGFDDRHRREDHPCQPEKQQ